MAGIKSICFEVYPESGNIMETLQRLTENGLDGWCSPLHNEKKPHYHLEVVRFPEESKGLLYKTWKDIADVCGAANGVFKKCSPHNYAAYLIHDRDKSKQQFPDYQVVEYSKDLDISINENNVISFGCVPDYMEYIKIHDEKIKSNKSSEQYKLIEIIQFCKDQNIISYANLVDWVIQNQIEWFETVISNSSQITAYMRSMEYTRKQFAENNKRDYFSDNEEKCAVLAFASSQSGQEPVISSKSIEIMNVLHEQGAMC